MCVKIYEMTGSGCYNNGRKGALWYEGSIYMVMGIPVEPIDIVGAGDTFLQPWPVHMLQVFQGLVHCLCKPGFISCYKENRDNRYGISRNLSRQANSIM